MSHHSRTGSIVIASIVTLAVLLSACRGGSTGSEPEASTTPQAASTTTAATPERAPTSTPVPRSTPVPEATAPGPGRITAILQADCGLGAAGIQLSISYGGRAQGGTLVSHVFLQVDGDLEEDSGLLAQREYRTTKTIPAAASSRHVVQVNVDGTAAPSSVGISVINCPRGPSGPRA